MSDCSKILKKRSQIFPLPWDCPRRPQEVSEVAAVGSAGTDLRLLMQGYRDHRLKILLYMNCSAKKLTQPGFWHASHVKTGQTARIVFWSSAIERYEFGEAPTYPVFYSVRSEREDRARASQRSLISL